MVYSPLIDPGSLRGEFRMAEGERLLFDGDDLRRIDVVYSIVGGLSSTCVLLQNIY